MKAGDLAEVLPHEDGCFSGGEIVMLVQYKGLYQDPWSGFQCENCWQVDFEGDDQYAINERALKPLYDGNEKTFWEDCVWQPK